MNSRMRQNRYNNASGNAAYEDEDECIDDRDLEDSPTANAGGHSGTDFIVPTTKIGLMRSLK